MPSEGHGQLARVTRHFLPPLGILGAVALYAHLDWDEIPFQFAVHWTTDGIPNGWTDKTASGIYGWLLCASLIVLALAGLSLAILLGSHRRNAASASATLSLLTVVGYTITTGFSLPAIFALRSVHQVPLKVLLSIFVALMVTYFALLNRICFRLIRMTGRR